MKQNYIFLVTIISVVFTAGCSRLLDYPRAVWGFSTRALEEARANAVQETFPCDVDACFNAVLQLTEADDSTTPPTEKVFDLFMRNRRKSVIVLMGVPDSVDTTEVGVFFAVLEPQKIQVDISSLSTNARERAAEIIFKALGEQYPEVR